MRREDGLVEVVGRRLKELRGHPFGTCSELGCGLPLTRDGNCLSVDYAPEPERRQPSKVSGPISRQATAIRALASLGELAAYAADDVTILAVRDPGNIPFPSEPEAP